MIYSRASLLVILTVLTQVSAAFYTVSAQAGNQEPTYLPTPSTSCEPLETRSREAEKYIAALEGQTRACGLTARVKFNTEVVARGLSNPWSVEPLPNGDLLVSERKGNIRIVSSKGKVGDPLLNVPKVDSGGQGGLLDIALSPDFSQDRTIFWSFSEPREKGNATSVARGKLSLDGKSLAEVKVILRTEPAYTNNMHFGSRLAFAPDKTLFVTMGERSDLATRPQAQQLNSHLGKILHITQDGKPAPNNPFLKNSNARPEIWSYGHRNVQAAAIDPKGQLWGIEHGPRGGDELNKIEPGKNYGWPLITYGIEYSGEYIKGATTQKEGFEQPIYFWDPVIGPSGAEFYTGEAFPAWKNSLFIGALKEMRLVRLVIENDKVIGEEHFLADRKQRIRDVKQGPDGLLYVVTDSGTLLKLSPQK